MSKILSYALATAAALTVVSSSLALATTVTKQNGVIISDHRKPPSVDAIKQDIGKMYNNIQQGKNNTNAAVAPATSTSGTTKVIIHDHRGGKTVTTTQQVPTSQLPPPPPLAHPTNYSVPPGAIPSYSDGSKVHVQGVYGPGTVTGIRNDGAEVREHLPPSQVNYSLTRTDGSVYNIIMTKQADGTWKKTGLQKVKGGKGCGFFSSGICLPDMK